MRMLGNVRRGRAAVSVVVMLRRSARDLDLTEQVVLTVDQFGAVYVGAAAKRVPPAAKPAPTSYEFKTREPLDWRRIARENPEATLLRVEIRPLKGATETKSSLLIGTREELERVVKFVQPEFANPRAAVSHALGRGMYVEGVLRGVMGGCTPQAAEVFARKGMRVTVTDVSNKS